VNNSTCILVVGGVPIGWHLCPRIGSPSPGTDSLHIVPASEAIRVQSQGWQEAQIIGQVRPQFQ